MQSHLVDVEAMAGVEADLGGFLEPVAGRLGGREDDALDDDLPIDDRHYLGLFLDGWSDWRGRHIWDDWRE